MKYFLLVPIFAIVGFLIWFFGFSQFSPFLKNKIISPKPQFEEQTLKISQPENGEVLELSNLKITGKAKPTSFLVVFNTSDTQILKVAASGEFTTNLNLTEGANLVKFANFQLEGSITETQIDIFYLSEKFRSFLGSPKTATSSGSQDVIKRLTQLRQKQNLKVLAGTVKGILGKNLALETNLTSKTVVVGQETEIRNFADISKKLELTQIQSADFAVAIGTFVQQGILTARILLINPDKPPVFAKIAKFGIITQLRASSAEAAAKAKQDSAEQAKVEKNSLELTDLQTGKVEIVSFGDALILDEQNQKIMPEKIEVGNKLVIVGKQEKDKLAAEKILQIQGNFLIELEKFLTPPLSTKSATQSATPSSQ